LGERWFCKPEAVGSIPAISTIVEDVKSHHDRDEYYDTHHREHDVALHHVRWLQEGFLMPPVYVAPMRGVSNPEARAEAIKLRVERRLSVREIATEIGVSTGSVGTWLHAYPLSDQEVSERHSANRYKTPKKDRGLESKFHAAIGTSTLDRRQKMKIAEAAVLFRLSCYGYNAFKPVFDGDRVDWVVQTDQAKLLRLQVKWAKKLKEGLPTISLVCVERGSFRRYEPKDFDFIVGYDFYTDTAYVYSYEETRRCHVSISVSAEAAERWDKLKNAG
jgi:transposase-like protein